jgi:hypothetical protein
MSALDHWKVAFVVALGCTGINVIVQWLFGLFL